MNQSKNKQKKGDNKGFFKATFNLFKKLLIYKFQLLFLLSFFLITPLLPYFYSSANNATEDVSAYKMMLALQKLFGQESDMYHSSISSEATVLAHFIIDYISTMLAALVVFLMFYNTVRLMINLAAKGKNEDQMKSGMKYGIKAVCFLTMAGFLSPVMSLERTLPNGSISHIPVYQVLGEEILIGFTYSIEKLSSKKDMKDFLISDFEVKSKFTIEDDVIDFTQAYLSNDFDSEGVEQINIVETERLYQADIKMGSDYFTYKFNKNIETHSKALELGIDLTGIENQFIQSYFKALTDNAYGVKKAIKDTHFFGDNIFSSFKMRNHEPQFQKNYKLYCDNLYEPIQKLSNSELNSYIIISAKCTSDKFMTEHYSNDYWDYSEVVEGATKLTKNYTTYFGNENLKLNIDKIVESTKSICDESYLACVDTIPFAHRKYLIANANNGLSSAITRQTARVFDISLSGSDVLDSRLVEVKPAKTDDYENMSFISDLALTESVVDFQTMPGNYNKRMAMNPLEYADLEALNLPSSPDEMFRSVVGKKPEYLYNRFITCIKYPDMIKNGFRCENVTSEISRYAVTGLETGIRIYLGGKILETFMAKKNKKNPAAQLGNSKAKKIAGKIAGISITTYFASYAEAPFFQSGYYSGETVNAYLIVMAILMVFGVDASGMTMLGVLLVTGSGLTLLLLFTPFVVFIKFIVTHMIKVILAVTFYLGFSIINAINSDKQIKIKSFLEGLLEGLLEEFKNIMKDMVKVVVAIVFFKGMIDYMDVVFGNLIREVFEILQFSVSGIVDIILNAPSLILTMLMLWLMMLALFRDHFQQNIDQAIN
ncbi:hypothetical protein MW344_004872 [Vibrio parahaemolyticus]|nr:hypothetical protein [Vibrio parahaemolyticus]